MLQHLEYPPTFLRGIPNKTSQYFDNLGRVTGYIFKPHSEQTPINGFYKLSIDWEDNETVIDFTRSKRRPDNGTLHFQGGVARVLREEIDRMVHETPFARAVAYNREIIDANLAEGIVGNPYHGNLLLSEVSVNNVLEKKALFARLKKTIRDVVPPIEEIN